MLKRCARCGGRVLTATMTEGEERVYAAAFRCVSCGRRYVELWPTGEDRAEHVPIEEK